MIAVGDSLPASVRRTPLTVGVSSLESRGGTRPATTGAQIDVITAVSVPAAPMLLQQILSLDPAGEVLA